jgi:hypothetical protein
MKITQGPDIPDAPMLGRMSIDKQYHGDLEATAVGQMLTAGTELKAWRHVAVERERHAERRHGTFLLHHRGVMTRGHLICPSRSCRSGTGELTG